MYELSVLLCGIDETAVDAGTLALARALVDGEYRESELYAEEHGLYTPAEADAEVELLAVTLANPGNWPAGRKPENEKLGETK